MSRWLEKLNAEQRQAVEITEGPLLVLAGAGSGKTRVITHRIAYLLERGVSPENVLGVTFTNKAAEEMRLRLRSMVGEPARGVTLCTFHALGLEILKQEARGARRRRPFTIFDTGDQLATLRELTRQTRFGKAFDLGAVLTRISALKNAFAEPGAEPASEDPYDELAALLFGRYVEQLRAYRAYDFDDLICEPVRLLEGSRAARERWTAQLAYLMVDEYQDTNPAQLRLLLALTGEHRNVCVVGDDDQSIYGWRGADVRNILQFGKDFPGARVVYLMRNYRSVRSVLDLANRVIAANPDRHPKQMKPVREDGPRVRLAIHPDGEGEPIWVARRMRELLDKGGRRPGDLAVLYRSNSLAKELESELRLAKIPYRLVGGTSFYDRREVKDLVAYLKLCSNPFDELSLRRVINTPPRGIGTRTVEKLSEWAEARGKPLWEALSNAEEAIGDDDRAVRAVGDFHRIVSEHGPRLSKGRALPEAVQSLVEATGMREEIQRSSESDQVLARRLGFVEGFLEDVARYAERADRPSLAEHLGHIGLGELEPNVEEDAGDKVTLSTLHGSKGLEFPVVFLVGLEEGLLPHDRTLNPQATDQGTGDISEERRLFYVGITRAKDELFLSRAKARRVRGRLVERSPSRFLDGIPEDMLELEDLTAEASDEQVSSMLDDLKSKLGW
ncbi:MAG: UvrD-helicase domain-containing protein [Polyangia bacterium]|jgi:DNA helicase-2/ATP-dependent DNA helicase PcrA|nr:UvrD-helicase domain-containing protein [Polyangia bacterium]